MTAHDTPDPADELVRRVRQALAGHDGVREVRMFGGLSFMVAGAMAVAAGRDGDLLVRTRPADHEALLAQGGEPAVMGERPMGPGWLRVRAGRLQDDGAVERWVEVGLQGRRPQA